MTVLVVFPTLKPKEASMTPPARRTRSAPDEAEAPDSASQPGPEDVEATDTGQSQPGPTEASGESEAQGGTSFAYGDVDEAAREDLRSRLYRGQEEGEGGTSFAYGDTPTKPAQSDTKAEWVQWAVSQGDTQEDAESSTKDDLIERHG